MNINRISAWQPPSSRETRKIDHVPPQPWDSEANTHSDLIPLLTYPAASWASPAGESFIFCAPSIRSPATESFMKLTNAFGVASSRYWG